MRAVRSVAVRPHSHETEHARFEMDEDSADYQIFSWISEMHYLDPVRWLQARIQPPVNPPVRVGDQRRRRRRRLTRREDGYGRVYIARLRPVVVDDHLVEAGDDEVDGAARLDLGHLGDYHVVVEKARVGGVREPVVPRRRQRHPRAKADGSILWSTIIVII